MALQSSGAISIDDIATEFGGTAPHSINEYYRGGGLVPDSAANAGIPSSGQVSLDDFYGGSAASTATPGYLYSWGVNNVSSKYGAEASEQTAIGNNDTTNLYYSVPTQTSAGGSDWVDVKTGTVSRMALKSDGRLWMWGNAVGACAGPAPGTDTISTTKNFRTPVQAVGSATTWAKLGWFGINVQGAGYNGGGSAIKTDGRLWVWGYELAAQGHLGLNGGSGWYSSPVQTVSGGTDWAMTSGSWVTHTAIKTDGRLWVWGVNSLGTLGNNTSTGNVSSPIQTAAGGTNWESVMSNDFQACQAIKTDGRLWGWGQNNFGQLATNNSVSYSSPVETVGGATNWSIVCEGGLGGATGIKTDGRLWGWSQGTIGQLGNNTAAVGYSVSSPVQTVAGGTDWQQSTGGFTKISIKTDGKLWGWGSGNLYGLIGGSTSFSSPVIIDGGTNWVKIHVGIPGYHSAIKT